MRAIRTGIIAILSSFIVLLLLSNMAYGITGTFKPDSTPYVGVVVLFKDAARTQPIGYCTGVLLSPTIVLTAGHSCICAAASVCFDKGPIPYSIENGEIHYSTNEPIYTGTPVPYPEYALSVLSGGLKGNKIFSVSDVGLILLDKPVEGITEFAVLPAAGFVDSLSIGTDLRVAGYGVQYQILPKNNGPLNSWIGTLSCNSASVRLLSKCFDSSSKYLKCSANPSQDKGGIAFGDSGGPVLYNAGSGEIVIGINSYVNNANCAGVTYHCRVDVPAVRNWIISFL